MRFLREEVELLEVKGEEEVEAERNVVEEPLEALEEVCSSWVDVVMKNSLRYEDYNVDDGVEAHVQMAKLRRWKVEQEEECLYYRQQSAVVTLLLAFLCHYPLCYGVDMRVNVLMSCLQP